jgi:hypothetical protein
MRWLRTMSRVVVLGRGEDLGPVPVQGHGGGPEGAADLAGDGGAGDAVVDVVVVAGEAAGFVSISPSATVLFRAGN